MGGTVGLREKEEVRDTGPVFEISSIDRNMSLLYGARAELTPGSRAENTSQCWPGVLRALLVFEAESLSAFSLSSCPQVPVEP